VDVVAIMPGGDADADDVVHDVVGNVSRSDLIDAMDQAAPRHRGRADRIDDVANDVDVGGAIPVVGPDRGTATAIGGRGRPAARRDANAVHLVVLHGRIGPTGVEPHAPGARLGPIDLKADDVDITAAAPPAAREAGIIGAAANQLCSPLCIGDVGDAGGGR